MVSLFDKKCMLEKQTEKEPYLNKFEKKPLVEIQLLLRLRKLKLKFDIKLFLRAETINSSMLERFFQ